MRVKGQREIQSNVRKDDDEGSSNNDEDENDWCMGSPYDDVEDNVIMYGGCMKGVHCVQGVQQYLRLWFGNTIGKSWSVPVILQITGVEVNIGSLDDISACIDSYLCKKE